MLSLVIIVVAVYLDQWLVAIFILAWKWKRNLNMGLTKVLARKFDSRNWPLIGLGEDFVHCGNTAIWIS